MKLPSFYKRIYKALLLGSVAASLNAYAVGAQDEFENLNSLAIEVSEYARTAYSQEPMNTRVQIKLSGLDERLRLARCDQAHNLNLQDSLGTGGHVNVAVSCRGANKWAILVPVTASVYRKVPVASRALTLGTQVAETDIQLEERELSDLRLGFYLDTQDIVGKQVKFAINSGDTFRTSWVEAPVAIKRGEEVSLEAEAGGIRVVTRATAITDGRLGQQIRVKNTQSEKIVNGRVTGPGRVKTLL